MTTGIVAVTGGERMDRIADVTTGSLSTWRGTPPPPRPLPVSAPAPILDPAWTSTRLPSPERTQVRAVPAPSGAAMQADDRPRGRVPAATGLAVAGGAALLVSAVSVFLPWHDGGGGAPGIVGSGFGLTVLVVSAALIATVVVDLLERRVRWSAALLVPPLALGTLVLAASVAALLSGTSTGVHLALAGVPWPGPVMSGPGLWVLVVAQAACVAVGVVGLIGWWHGWGDPDPATTPSARRPVVLAGCVVAVLVVVVVTGVVLADRAPAAAQPTVGAAR